MELITIFDLDGVLIDNVAYERAVTEHIVKSLSSARQIELGEALAIWNQQLAVNAENPRWHDYSFHCSTLGIPDAWEVSHLAMRHLIRPMPNASEAIGVGRRSGMCWLASDATSWVVEFKLNVAGLGTLCFDEVFTLDRCGASKGFDSFWRCLLARITDCNTALIVIDNRLDRLLSAMRILPNCQLILVDAEDHPTSLRIFSQPRLAGIQLHRATHQKLPSVISQVATEIDSIR